VSEVINMMGAIREHRKELSSAHIRSPLPLNRGWTAQWAASLRDVAASCFPSSNCERDYAAAMGTTCPKGASRLEPVEAQMTG
jgi:hypothetical protein